MNWSFRYFLILSWLMPKLLYAQKGGTKLDSFDKLRQAVLIQYINQLSTGDTINLYKRDIYEFYRSWASTTVAARMSPAQGAEMIKREVEMDREHFIKNARTYCNCQSVADIKALPFRFFKQTHPDLYQNTATDTFLGPVLNSTAFYVYCPAKQGRKNQVIAVAWFWPGAQIILTSTTMSDGR